MKNAVMLIDKQILRDLIGLPDNCKIIGATPPKGLDPNCLRLMIEAEDLPEPAIEGALPVVVAEMKWIPDEANPEFVKWRRVYT